MAELKRLPQPSRAFGKHSPLKDQLARRPGYGPTMALESRGIDLPGAEAPSAKERGGVRAGAGPQAAPVAASVLLPSMACASAP